MLMNALTSFFAPTPSQPRPIRTDEEMTDIARGVHAHCKRIGCDESNTLAAIAWALRTPGDTFTAARAGKQRAAQLLRRQQPTKGCA